MTQQNEFLCRAAAAAAEAGHVFPEYAACEAALESGWGLSRLAVEANNLFGQKQYATPLSGTGTLEMSTREFLHGQWVTVPARWVKFVDWASCFKERMRMLEGLSGRYPVYAKALQAASGEQFVTLVSSRWSTDPERAKKVLEVHDRHCAALITA